MANKQEIDKQELQILASIEDKIGVPHATFLQLRDEPNDWAFLIKLQVFLEAALAHVIVLTLGREELSEYVSQLNMGGKSGKIALAVQLEIIDRTFGQYLEALAEVRNSFAHRLENIGLDIETYARGLPVSKLRQLIKCCRVVPRNGEAEFFEKATDLARGFRMALWAGGTGADVPSARARRGSGPPKGKNGYPGKGMEDGYLNKAMTAFV